METNVATEILSESITHCRALLEEKRQIAQTEYAAMVEKQKDSGKGFDLDAMPEKPDDTLGDPLCRMEGEAIDEAVAYAQDFLDHVSKKLGGMNDKQAQRLVLHTVRAELNDHVFRGTPPAHCFDYMLSVIVELEEMFQDVALTKFPRSGEELRRKFFMPIGAYAEVAEETAYGIEDMMRYHQEQMGWPEEAWCDDLFRVAQRELEGEGLLKPSEEAGAVFTDAEMELCHERAKDLFERMLEPYADSLPMDYCAEHAWFVYKLTQAHAPKRPQNLNVEMADPVNPTRKHVHVCKAANDVMGPEAVKADLTRIFLKHLNTADDPYELLAATMDVDALMEPQGEKRGFGPRGA